MSAFRSVLLALAVFLVLLAIRLQPALGADPKDLINQAYDAIDAAKATTNEAARRRQRERALKLCEEAAAASPVPQSYMCLGAAHQALGDWAQAEASYLKALDFPDDPQVKKFRVPLEKALVAVRAYLGGT